MFQHLGDLFLEYKINWQSCFESSAKFLYTITNSFLNCISEHCIQIPVSVT